MLFVVFFGGVFGGIIVGVVIGGFEGCYGIWGWCWLFIVEGIIIIIWVMIVGFIFFDFFVIC